MTSGSSKRPQTTMCSPKKISEWSSAEMAKAQKERAHKQEGQTKKREHIKNKRGKPKRESTQRTRGANLGVVEVQRRAHVKIWCAHK